MSQGQFGSSLSLIKSGPLTSMIFPKKQIRGGRDCTVCSLVTGDCCEFVSSSCRWPLQWEAFLLLALPLPFLSHHLLLLYESTPPSSLQHPAHCPVDPWLNHNAPHGFLGSTHLPTLMARQSLSLSLSQCCGQRLIYTPSITIWIPTHTLVKWVSKVGVKDPRKYRFLLTK